MTKVAIVASALLLSANAAVYVAPADIDTYKQKTDQNFYDMYQNPDSAIAKGANPNLTTMSDNVDTDTRLYEGHTVSKIVQASVSGLAIQAGTAGSFSYGGEAHTIRVNDGGDVRFDPSAGVGTGGQMLSYAGNRSLSVSGETCVSSGKYGCAKKERHATEVFMDAASGMLTETRVKQDSTYSCGKGIGCTQTREWTSLDVVRMVKQEIDLEAILVNNETVMAIEPTDFGNSYSGGGSGKTAT